MNRRLIVMCAMFSLLLGFSVSADEAKVKIKGFPDGIKLESLNDPKEAARVAELVAKANPAPQSEAVRMFVSILRGSNMGPGEGWFGPCQTRYSWEWLAKHCQTDPKKGITRKQFPGTDAMFAKLDRDKSGAIEATDLDWSDRNPYVQQAYIVNRLFRRMDPQGDGKLTASDMQEFFNRVSKGKEYLTSDDLKEVLLSASSGFLPGDGPTTAMLVKGLFASEVGSLQEGPKLNQLAPDFVLKTVDGKDAVQLSKLVGKKPIVLVLGNFTCGPFRSFYPDVEVLHERYKNDANFLMVYVREAHPTDGWKMESNAKQGVAVAQPTNFGERVKVADQFCQRLKPTMPVVVDDITDIAGNGYSGMPARLYVIDRDGKIAYKSGRGPFGFRVGEAEQALLMELLDQSSAQE